MGALRSEAVDPHWPGKILQRRLADVFEGEVEAARRILLNSRRDADAARFGHPYEPRRDIDAVAEDVAFLDDDVALVDADAERDAALGRYPGIGFGQRRLHLDGAAKRRDDAGEFDEQPVAGTMRPRCRAIFGSMISARSVFSRPRVPSSSASISREWPATSAARIAASRRSTRACPAGSMASPRWQTILHQAAPGAH